MVQHISIFDKLCVCHCKTDFTVASKPLQIMVGMGGHPRVTVLLRPRPKGGPGRTGPCTGWGRASDRPSRVHPPTIRSGGVLLTGYRSDIEDSRYDVTPPCPDRAPRSFLRSVHGSLHPQFPSDTHPRGLPDPKGP